MFQGGVSGSRLIVLHFSKFVCVEGQPWYWLSRVQDLLDKLANRLDMSLCKWGQVFEELCTSWTNQQ